MRFWPNIIASLALTLGMLTATLATADAQSSVRPPANATTSDTPRGQSPGGQATGETPSQYDAQFWSKVRGRSEPAPVLPGVPTAGGAGLGTVSLPDPNARYLVDKSGWTWMALRNGAYATYGAYAMGAIVLLLAVFFLLRGRIRVEHGMSGSRIQRFTD
ncbi:MAG: hypothetical protein AAFR60_06795, partial [Pseudomonadota bacterium]